MLIEACSISKNYGDVNVVNEVSFSVDEGETVALVGESGSGKSTLGRILLNLEAQTSGTITTPLGRRDMQMIFQDPYGSLNPKMRISDSIAEGLDIHGIHRGNQVEELLEAVSLKADFATLYPRQLSGGQRQRVSIARALSLRPKLIVCDEPLASLDRANQRKILDLLLKLKRSHHLSYLYITHDLNSLPYIADRVLVLHQGEIVERTTPKQLLSKPQHPYSQKLVSSLLTYPFSL